MNSSRLLRLSGLLFVLWGATPANAQLRILDTRLTEGIPGVVYPGHQLKGAGGTAPYTFTITAGSPPQGITLSSGGNFTGTPQGVSKREMTIRITDATAAQATKDLVLEVNPPPAHPNWKLKALVGGPIQGVYLSPNFQTDQTLFARSGGREFYRSTNGGASYTRSSLTVDRKSRPMGGFLLSPVFNANSSATEAVRTVFGSEECGVYKSTDHGQNFTRKTAGLPAFCNGGAIAISPNYANDGTVWYAAYGSSFQNSVVYKSTDFGENWVAGGALNKLYSNPIPLLAASPTYASDNTLFAFSVYESKVYRSTDGGASFAPVALAFTPFRIAISPAFSSDHTVLLSDFSEKIYRSTDGGLTFSLLYTTPNWVTEGIKDLVYVPRPALAPLLLVKTGRAPYGILASEDHGDTFYRLYAQSLRGNYRTLAEADPVLAASRSASGALTLFAASGQGVELSDDSGRLFAPRENGVNAHDIGGIVGAGGGLAVGSHSFWLLSGDTGTTFLARGNPGNNQNTSTYYMSPNYDADGTLFAYGGYGLYRSTDRGQTFATAGASPYISGVTFAPNYDPVNGIVYAMGSGLLRSADGGVTFSSVTSTSGCLFDSTFNVTPYFSPSFPADGTLFAVVSDSSASTSILCRSVDSGATWQVVRSSYTTLFAISPVYDQRAANGTPQKTVFFMDQTGNHSRSTDGGTTAQASTGIGYCYGDEPAHFSPAYAADGTIYKPCDEYGIYRSTDYGANFTQIPGTAALLYYYNGFYLAPGFDSRNTSNSVAYFGTQNSGVWKSTDGARTFAPVADEGTMQSLDRSVNAVEPGPAGVLYAASAGQGVFQSTNGGGTFQPLNTGLPPAANAEAVAAPAAAPSQPVTAVKDKGLYRFNGGSWVPVTGGTGRYVDFAEGGGYLYAARKNGTSMRSTDNGQSWSLMGAALGDVNNIDYNPESTVDLAGNGSFETPSIGVTSLTTVYAPAQLGSWTLAAGSVDIKATYWPAARGAQSLDLTGDLTGPGDLYQDIPTVAGQKYRISFAFAGNPDCGPALKSAELRWAGALVDTLVYDSTGRTSADIGWVNREYTVTASASASRLRFTSLTTGYCGAALDNVRVVQVEGFGTTPLVALDDSPAAKFLNKRSDAAVGGNTAPLWAVSAASGPFYSNDSGVTWVSAPGGGDYQIPAGATWTVVRALGIDAASGARIVLAGTAKVGASTPGLFLTRDGGLTWRQVAGAGSGLEATSKDFAALMAAPTAFATDDLLIGAKGSTNGGVYLSGDFGEHWTQINQGFDPAQLSISTLVKTACNGCPVQYYSGSYGGGLYTRTVTVNAPPVIQSWNFGNSAGPCAQGASGGPTAGGQPLRLCGANFQSGLVVEFDGVAASGCTRADASTITCTGTPAHVNGPVSVRVRNPDTRAGVLPQPYLYAGGSSRIANSLRAAKAGQDASLTWTCSGCSLSSPAIVYRSQNAAFTLYVQNFVGGTDNTHLDPGAAGGAKSYFWSVE